MKTKLDLYQAIHAAAADSLELKPKEVDLKLAGLLKPLNLDTETQAQFSQLFHSRRQRMMELKNQPLAAKA